MIVFWFRDTKSDKRSQSDDGADADMEDSGIEGSPDMLAVFN
jgi:hypothetical protein